MLPAEIAQAVKRIQFVTGRQVSDVMAGAYLSVFKGRGMEFDEVRPYVPGDDVRTIDWNVTARAGRPFVKQFREERELTLMLVVDVSASGEFGSGAQQILREPDGVFEPDAPMAQRPVFLVEQRILRGIVQVDVESVREQELHEAERVPWSGLLAEVQSRNRRVVVPIHTVGVDHFS